MCLLFCRGTEKGICTAFYCRLPLRSRLNWELHSSVYFHESHLVRNVFHHSPAISTCLFSMNSKPLNCEQHLIISLIYYWRKQALIHIFVKLTIMWKWRLNINLEALLQLPNKKWLSSPLRIVGPKKKKP